MTTRTTLDDYTSRIRRVLEHVQAHLDHAMTPADLAEIACFSPFHFQRVFRAMVGESVMGHVRRLRLEQAAWKLKFSDAPVAAIAWGAGYEAHEAFTRAFGARFDCSPSEYRDQHRSIQPLLASCADGRSAYRRFAFLEPKGRQGSAWPPGWSFRTSRASSWSAADCVAGARGLRTIVLSQSSKTSSSVAAVRTRSLQALYHLRGQLSELEIELPPQDGELFAGEGRLGVGREGGGSIDRCAREWAPELHAALAPQ